MKNLIGIFAFLSFAALVMPSAAEPVVAVSKAYVDSGLVQKAQKSAVDAIVISLAAKADVANVYTKTEADAAFATTAQGAKADAAIPATEKGAPSGVATLGADGKVPTAQLPESNAVNADWNATTGAAQILNKPAVGTVAGTIAAGDDSRFSAVATSAPVGAPPAGYVYMWFE